MSNEGFDQRQSTGKGVNAWVWVGAKKKTQQSQAMMPHLSIFVGTSVASTKKAERKIGGDGRTKRIVDQEQQSGKRVGQAQIMVQKRLCALTLGRDWEFVL